MLQKFKKFARTAGTFATLVAATAGPALANCGGFDTTDLDQGTVGFLNVIAGTPFYVGGALALVAAIIAIFFDGGHVPQFIKVIVGIIIGITIAIGVIGWLVAKAHCGNFSVSG